MKPSLIMASVSLITLAGMTVPASAWMRGNGLHEFCISANEGESAICAAYIGGILDTIAMQVGLKRIRPVYCLPAGSDLRQQVDVVKKYLADTPQERQYPAASIAVQALTVAFPCPKL